MSKRQSIVQDTFVQVLDYTSGSSSATWMLNGGTTNTGSALNSSAGGIILSNDSTSVSLTCQIGKITMTLMSGEKFEGRFDPFNMITITATDAWRLWVFA